MYSILEIVYEGPYQLEKIINIKTKTTIADPLVHTDISATGLPTKDKIVATNRNTLNITFPRVNIIFCHEYSRSNDYFPKES